MNKLINLGVIFREQKTRFSGDTTNYYAINPCVVDNSGIRGKIFPTMVKKIRNIIDSNINHNKSNIGDESKEIYENKIRDGYRKKRVTECPTTSITSDLIGGRNFSSKRNAVQDYEHVRMLKMYNEMFGKEEVMTKHKAKYLKACLRDKFYQSLKKWNEYLERIRSSCYIMSNKFNIFLNNILKFSFIERIFRGELGVKPLELSPEEDARSFCEAYDHIASTNEDQECRNIRIKILVKFGSLRYLAEFTKIGLKKLENGMIEVFGDAFLVDYIYDNFFRGIADMRNVRTEAINREKLQNG
jgi:hypothetical protein